MKIHLFLFLFSSFLIYTNKLNAQTNEFAPVGAKWWYDYDRIAWYGYMQIESIKDTLIDSKNCRVLMKTKHYIDLSTSEHPLLISNEGYEYVYENDSVVYYLSSGQFYKLYDFTANVGETWEINDDEIPSGIISSECDTIGVVEVIEKGDTILSTLPLMKIRTQPVTQSPFTFHENEIIEKIGSLYYLFPDVTDCISNTENYAPGLLRCYQDDDLGTINFLGEECEYIYSDITTESIFDIRIYPNPANNYFVIQSGENFMEDAQVEIMNMAGEIVQMEKIKKGTNSKYIEIKNLHYGIYIMKIFDNKNRSTIKKILISR